MANSTGGGNGRKLDVSALGSWLWKAACAIRGPMDAPKFKDYILPLIFIKRLSDVFDDEFDRVVAEFDGDRDLAQLILQDDHRLVRFYIPEAARWSAIAQHSYVGLGQYLTDVVRGIAQENESLHGVIDVIDFNATTAGQRIVSDERLNALVEVLNEYRLGLTDVEPDVLGRAYEYLLRKFAEGQGTSAGEFYTPREIAELMARLLNPQPGMSAYDPTVGSAGLLVKLHQEFLRQNSSSTGGRAELSGSISPLGLYGQEENPTTYAIARMNLVLHSMEVAAIAVGDTMRRPQFTNTDGSLRTFDLVMANPMWNQKFPDSVYEHDGFNRFPYGIPPANSADWGWLQHMLASLSERGRMAVVLDTMAVSRGSGSKGTNRTRDIRRAFVEGTLLAPGDLIEAVILLPENLFYNTPARGIIIVINRNKRHPGEILLVNASRLFVKERPKNVLPNEHAQQIVKIYFEWRAEEGLSTIITSADAARNDYNLSPSRYISNGEDDITFVLEDAVLLLQEAEESRRASDDALRQVLVSLGLLSDASVAPLP